MRDQDPEDLSDVFEDEEDLDRRSEGILAISVDPEMSDGITLGELLASSRSELWWRIYLDWHPGRWLELEGSACAARSPEWWIVAACLN